jgi:hypothetical protein
MTTTTDHPLQHMVAPGQEDIFEEFLKEQAGEAPQGEGNDSDPLGQFLKAGEVEGQPPAAAEDDGLPEKYRGKSAAEVYRLVQQEQQYRAQQQEQAPAAVEIPEFSREKSVIDYGESLTAAFESAEVNPYEISAKVQAGQEVNPGDITKLAQATGFPESVVEGYINSFRPAPAAPTGQPLDQAAVAEIVQQAGGAERMAKVNEWVTANVDAAEIDAFNSILESGNKGAALALLRGFDARYSAATPREPQLIAGGKANLTGGAMVFEDMEELTAAMAKTDERGQKLYTVDPKYRKEIDAAVARSNF